MPCLRLRLGGIRQFRPSTGVAGRPRCNLAGTEAGHAWLIKSAQTAQCAGGAKLALLVMPPQSGACTHPRAAPSCSFGSTEYGNGQCESPRPWMRPPTSCSCTGRFDSIGSAQQVRPTRQPWIGVCNRVSHVHDSDQFKRKNRPNAQHCCANSR